MPLTWYDWVLQIATDVAGLFVFIPVFVSFFRAVRRYSERVWLAGWSLRIFFLPAEFRKRFGWFVPVYYWGIGLAIAAGILMILVLGLRDMACE